MSHLNECIFQALVVQAADHSDLCGRLFLLITGFVAYTLQGESEYLYRSSRDETTNLAELLAVSSASWVLADDVVGLQEAVNSFKSHSESRYAMVITTEGRVLATRWS